MSDRIIAIISTAEAAKARAGVMFSVNALKNGWLEDVKLFFFGPAEELLLHDDELQRHLEAYQALEGTPQACKFIADQVVTQGEDADTGEGIAAKISTLGVDVQYIGKPISDLIREGYVPMVW